MFKVSVYCEHSSLQDTSGNLVSPSFRSRTISESEAEVDHVREELSQSESDKARLQAQLEVGDRRQSTMEQEIADLQARLELLQKEKNETQLE